jgi:hypothetical protein
MWWLHYVCLLCSLAIINILAECNSNECRIEIDPTSISILPAANTNDNIQPIDH